MGGGRGLARPHDALDEHQSRTGHVPIIPGDHTIPSFRAFSQFNQGDPTPIVASHYGLNRAVADRHFAGDSLQAAIVRSLADARCITTKEVVESFEVFQVVRKDVRSPVVADVCCGHGLAGMLLAAYERQVEAVYLCDPKFPEGSRTCLGAVAQVAPWIAGRVHHHAARLRQMGDEIPFTSALATHACGRLTDECLGLAIERGCAVAVTPCCYNKRTSSAPPVLVRELGIELACDTQRTCRLHREGYKVKWKYIPEAISPMNRVIIATR